MISRKDVRDLYKRCYICKEFLKHEKIVYTISVTHCRVNEGDYFSRKEISFHHHCWLNIAGEEYTFQLKDF